MKKRLLLLLPILLLTGCEEVETTAPDPLADALSKLQTDICLTGTSTKKENFKAQLIHRITLSSVAQIKLRFYLINMN